MSARDVLEKAWIDASGALAWGIEEVGEALTRVAHRIRDEVPDVDTRVSDAFDLGVEVALATHGIPRERRTVDTHGARRAHGGVTLHLLADEDDR